MILSEYEAKRMELDQKMKEIGEREAAHKMELSIKYQAECKKIQAQIGQLKKRQKDALKQCQNDKAWFHRRYRDEKHEVTQAMHLLRMEYLTVTNPEAINNRDRGRANESQKQRWPRGSHLTTIACCTGRTPPISGRVRPLKC